MNFLNYKQQPYCASNYKILKLNIKGLQFPIISSDISNIERQNREMRFLVYVYKITNGKVAVERLARDKHADITEITEINVLIIMDPNGVNGH